MRKYLALGSAVVLGVAALSLYVATSVQAADGEVGASSNWGGWAAVDQLVRLLAGQPPLDIMEENQPEHIFVKSNAPADGVLDFQKIYDYKGKYLELWGRK